jgi:hypothetical protein
VAQPAAEERVIVIDTPFDHDPWEQLPTPAELAAALREAALVEAEVSRDVALSNEVLAVGYKAQLALRDAQLAEARMRLLDAGVTTVDVGDAQRADDLLLAWESRYPSGSVVDLAGSDRVSDDDHAGRGDGSVTTASTRTDVDALLSEWEARFGR